MTVPATFAERWRQAVAAGPDRTFLIWEGADERVTSWTYASFDDLVGLVLRRPELLRVAGIRRD